MRFFLNHFTEIVGGLCLAWGLFALGRLYERESYDKRVMRDSWRRLERAMKNAAKDEGGHVRIISEPFDRDHDI